MRLSAAEETLRTAILARLGRRPYKELARGIGVSEQMVGEMLNGHRGIRVAHFDALAAFFGVPVHELFLIPDRLRDTSPAPRPPVSARDARLVSQNDYYSALNDIATEVERLRAARPAQPPPLDAPAAGTVCQQTGRRRGRQRADSQSALPPRHAPKRRAG